MPEFLNALSFQTSQMHPCVDSIAAPSCKLLPRSECGWDWPEKLRESISLVPQAEDLDGFNFGLWKVQSFKS